MFRAVALGGRVSAKALEGDSAWRIVKRYASRVGLDAASYAGRNLRSGFLTSAAESGAGIIKMMETSCAAMSARGTCSRSTRGRRFCEERSQMFHLFLAFLIAGGPGVIIWLLLCGGDH